MTDAADLREATRRCWHSLSDQQRDIAADLMTRAQQMWEDADGEISLREAIELAAFRSGRQAPGSVQ